MALVAQCPVCGHEVLNAPGIGPFCSNLNCDVGDGLALYNDDGERVADPPEFLFPKFPKLVRASVVRESGPDMCYLTFKAPSPIWPFDGQLSMKFEAAAGTGAQYIRDFFGIEPEVIEPSKSGTSAPI